jgi:hypothetical protein
MSSSSDHYPSHEPQVPSSPPPVPPPFSPPAPSAKNPSATNQEPKGVSPPPLPTRPEAPIPSAPMAVPIGNSAAATPPMAAPVMPQQQASTTVPLATPVLPPTPTASPIPRPTPGPAKPILRPTLVAGNQPVPPVEEDDDGEEDTARAVVKAVPAWLVSTIVHTLLLIVLALLTFITERSDKLVILLNPVEEEGVQLEDLLDDPLKMEQPEIEEPVLSEAVTPVEDPLATPPELVELDINPLDVVDAVETPVVGMALTGREPGMKKALLAVYGGTGETEEAVARALEWLARNQQRDGSWSLQGPYKDGAAAENKVAATAMALLAFQGAGHTHQDGAYKRNVANAWSWLIKKQDKDGNFFHEGRLHDRLYTQAQATIALCELYGMTKDPEYKKAAQRAIDYAVRNQDRAGGWRYTPGQDSDTSVTGWFVMALQSGLMAGLEVPSPTLEKINKYLDRVAKNGGRRYAYTKDAGATTSMSAEGLLCRQYLGWKHDDERLTDGVTLLLAEPIDYDDANVYSWYYATQVLHYMEGAEWDQWNDRMRKVVPEHQEKEGRERGSWNPNGDRWGGQGGRLYTTCLSTYMLEVYYRHLPIYQQSSGFFD